MIEIRKIFYYIFICFICTFYNSCEHFPRLVNIRAYLCNDGQMFYSSVDEIINFGYPIGIISVSENAPEFLYSNPSTSCEDFDILNKTRTIEIFIELKYGHEII